MKVTLTFKMAGTSALSGIYFVNAYRNEILFSSVKPCTIKNKNYGSKLLLI